MQGRPSHQRSLLTGPCVWADSFWELLRNPDDRFCLILSHAGAGYCGPSPRVTRRMMLLGVQSRSQSGQVVGCSSGASSKRIISAGHSRHVSHRDKLETERDDWKEAARRESDAARELRVLLKGAQDSTRALTATLEPHAGPGPSDAPHGATPVAGVWDRLRRWVSGGSLR